MVYGSGYWLTASCYGLPDAGLATYTQMLERMTTLKRTVGDTAVIADADTGYGGLLNVHHTVRGYEEAGIAAIQTRGPGISETLRSHGRQASDPARGHGREDPRSLRSAPADADGMLVIARTDAIAVEGFDAALRRAEAYGNAGADILFIEAPGKRRTDAHAVPQQRQAHAGQHGRWR